MPPNALSRGGVVVDRMMTMMTPLIYKGKRRKKQRQDKAQGKVGKLQGYKPAREKAQC